MNNNQGKLQDRRGDCLGWWEMVMDDRTSLKIPKKKKKSLGVGQL